MTRWSREAKQPLFCGGGEGARRGRWVEEVPDRARARRLLLAALGLPGLPPPRGKRLITAEVPVDGSPAAPAGPPGLPTRSAHRACPPSLPTRPAQGLPTRPALDAHPPPFAAGVVHLWGGEKSGSRGGRRGSARTRAHTAAAALRGRSGPPGTPTRPGPAGSPAPTNQRRGAQGGQQRNTAFARRAFQIRNNAPYLAARSVRRVGRSEWRREHLFLSRGRRLHAQVRAYACPHAQPPDSW